MQHDSASARPPGDVMFKSLVLLQIVVTAKALRVVDSQARFKQFYRVENATRVHWTLQVDTKVFGTDFITFFASDIDRPLEYACAYSNALCDFRVIKRTHDPEKHQTTVYAHLQQPVHLATPAMSGKLMICTARTNLFWKRPLIVEGPVHPRWQVPATTSGNYFCQLISPKLSSERVFEIPPQSSKGHLFRPPLSMAITEDCPLQSYSCSNPFLIQPDIQSFDKPKLDVHIWYMTRENYREMHAGKLMGIIIPLLQGTDYTVHLYGTTSKPYSPKCHVTLPTGGHVPVKVTDKRMNRFKHPIPARAANSGVYSVTCSVEYTDVIEGGSHTIELKKSLNITFIQGPKITLEGQDGYTKYFPANATSAVISVVVYTTSPLLSFEVDSMTRQTSADMFASFVSSSPYEIVWKHSISLARLDYRINGLYRIRIVNEDRERASQLFLIHKANALTVIVSPAQLAVEVGSPVQLECAAIGNLIEHLKWAKDVEHTTEDVVNRSVADVKYGEAESRGLRLTIGTARLEDSGLYQCTASNRYESVTKAIKLIVWPIGGPYLSSNATSYFSPMPSGLTVLDISEEEIKREYFKPHLRASIIEKQAGKRAAKHRVVTRAVVGSVVAAVVVMVATIVTAIVVLWRCRRRRLEESKFAPERKMAEREGVQKRKNKKQRTRVGEESTPSGKSKGKTRTPGKGIQSGKEARAREEWETPGMENKLKTRRRSTPKGKGRARRNKEEWGECCSDLD